MTSAAARAAPEEQATRGNDPVFGRPYQVLVIDDDERLLALARLALAKHGVEVTTATTAAAGLELLRRVAPDLVILDVVMPDLSGWEALRRIRESSEVAVMLLSGRASDVDKARGLDLGADDYLTKPFSYLEFEARVRALLRRARWRPPAEPSADEQ
jgi:two-component system, OmpR family, phosphate regulon response regulator OmpR